MTTRKYYFVAILFFFVFLSLTVVRSQFGIVYDSTTAVAHHINKDETLADVTAEKIWFRQGGGPAYRALLDVYKIFLMELYKVYGALPAIVLNMFFLCMSGFFVFLLFSRLAGLNVGFLAGLAFVFFPPVVSANWVTIAGPQSLVPGLTALGLWAYLKFLENGARRYLLIILSIAILGPLFKETAGLLSFIILAHYLTVPGRKNPKFIMLIGFTCLHAVFPSFLINVIFYKNWALVPIFKMGALNDYVSSISVGSLNYRKRLFLDLIAYLPPSFFLVALFGAAYLSATSNEELKLNIGNKFSFNLVWFGTKVLPVMAAIVIGVYVLYFTLSIFGLGFKHTKLAIAATILLVVYCALFIDYLVAVWAGAVLFLLLLVYFNTTHIGYTAPFIIFILICIVRDLFLRVRERMPAGIKRKIILNGIIIISIVAFLDNGTSILNIYRAYGAMDNLANNPQIVQRLEGSCEESLKKSTYVTNTVLITDTFIPHIGKRGFYTFDFGVPPSNVIFTEDQLSQLIDNQQIFYVEKLRPAIRKHVFWKLKDIAHLFSNFFTVKTSYTGIYLDPLRMVADNRYRTVLVPPDFQDEFDKEGKGTPFRETFITEMSIGSRCKQELSSPVKLKIIPK